MTRRWTHVVAAGATLAATAALAVGTAGCGGSGTSSSSAKRAPAVAVSLTQLRALARSAGPIYWIGPASPGVTYELTRIADGRTYLRYLPPGAAVGTRDHHLTIGTYVESVVPLPAVRAAAQRKHALMRGLPGGELAVQYPAYPQSVYLAFPGAHYLVEVYDPSAGKALSLATSGKVVPIS